LQQLTTFYLIKLAIILKITFHLSNHNLIYFSYWNEMWLNQTATSYFSSTLEILKSCPMFLLYMLNFISQSVRNY